MTTVISSDLVTGGAGTAQPLTYARIGYNRISGTITASSAATGFPASSANNPLTSTYWKPNALPATWEINVGTATDVNYCGIAAHTLGTDSSTVTVQEWNGTTWDNIDSAAPGDDSPILFIFSTKSRSKYRISITGSTQPRVGVIFFGELLEMQRGIYAGHTPATLARKTEYKNNISENGQWLGRTIVRAGSRTSYNWKNLTSAWYRANFDPFVEAARTQGFFIAWNPSDFPDEVLYGWTNDDIRPSNNGKRDMMDVSMTVEGLAVE